MDTPRRLCDWLESQSLSFEQATPRRMSQTTPVQGASVIHGAPWTTSKVHGCCIAVAFGPIAGLFVLTRAACCIADGTNLVADNPVLHLHVNTFATQP